MTNSSNNPSDVNYSAVLECLRVELTARALGKPSMLSEDQVQKLKKMQDELRKLGQEMQQEALTEIKAIAKERFPEYCLLPMAGSVDPFGKVGDFTVIVLSFVNENILEQIERAMTLSEKFSGIKVTTRLKKEEEDFRHFSCTHCN